ncbi:MAG: hypothetical protein HQ532_02275 [Candidatus Omnitrophica bacterium]|nr:hypothetical protein [Candidatus Omnitrophota bacterium]
MYYFIIRRKIRTILLIVLLATVIVSVIPRLYEKIFLRDKDFVGTETDLMLRKSFIPDVSEKDRDVSLELSFLNHGFVFCKGNVDISYLEGAGISGDFFAKGRIVKDEKDQSLGFKGKLSSKNITLNSKPFLPVRASFNIKEGELEIEALRMGKAYELKGVVGLVTPHKADIMFKINRADMRDLSKVSKMKNRDVAFGIVSGSFHIKGDLAGNIFSEGTLESRKGRLGAIEYDIVKIRLEGFGPIINIVDSSFKENSGTLTMEGYVDLRNVSKGGMFDGIRVRSDVKTIVWRDWDITKDGADELRMEKDVGDNMRVGFKTVARDPLPSYRESENSEEISLKYNVGMENLQMKLKDNEEFFGVEHSVKF